MATTILTAPKIKCEGCVQTITQTLKPVQGVQGVQVDIGGKKVTVTYEPAAVSVAQIRDKLAAAGFPPA